MIREKTKYHVDIKRFSTHDTFCSRQNYAGFDKSILMD